MDALAYLRFPLALVFVLALIGIAAWALRRLGWPPGGAGGSGRRLQLIETLSLDPKRRIVLVRRDGREHLVLVAPEGAMLLEGGIAAPPPERAEAGRAGSA